MPVPGSFASSTDASVPAVLAQGSNGSKGVNGNSDSAIGVGGASVTGTGVYGESIGGEGVHGQTSSPDGGSAGVKGVNTGSGPGIYGQSSSTSNPGVYGTNDSNDGVLGRTSSTDAGNAAVRGINTGAGPGLYGQSSSDDGVFGRTNSSHAGVNGVNGGTGNGVFGRTSSSSANSAAVYGTNTGGGPGVYGVSSSTSNPGVYGTNDSNYGVLGRTKSGSAAVAGINAGKGPGLFGQSTGGGVAGEFTGDVTVSGTLKVAVDVQLTGGMDCAERFDLSELATGEPGTVMVIGEDGGLRPSERAYDKSVAGVVSGAGAYRPGIVLGGSADDQSGTTIALVGKVYCKVDANEGPIAVGDLLTTSNTPGHAMRVADAVQGIGSIIGKSLGSLRSGSGLLPILVALQ